MQSETRMCSEIVSTFIVDGSLKQLDLRRIVKAILEGDATRRIGVESQLRENEEAIKAMFAEEEGITRRVEKVERLKIAWKNRIAARKLKQMPEKLKKLSVEDLDIEIGDIEELVLDIWRWVQRKRLRRCSLSIQKMFT